MEPFDHLIGETVLCYTVAARHILSNKLIIQDSEVLSTNLIHDSLTDLTSHLLGRVIQEQASLLERLGHLSVGLFQVRDFYCRDDRLRTDGCLVMNPCVAIDEFSRKVNMRDLVFANKDFGITF